jgi:hypothetical protein
MSRPTHEGSFGSRRRKRRTNSAITAVSLAVGLWLGLTAPQVSAVAPPPVVAAAVFAPLPPFPVDAVAGAVVPGADSQAAATPTTRAVAR